MKLLSDSFSVSYHQFSAKFFVFEILSLSGLCLEISITGKIRPILSSLHQNHTVTLNIVLWARIEHCLTSGSF